MLNQGIFRSWINANKLIIAAIILEKDVSSPVHKPEAVWVKEKDIGRTNVIIELANEYGFQGKTYLILVTRLKSKILKENTEEASIKIFWGSFVDFY